MQGLPTQPRRRRRRSGPSTIASDDLDALRPLTVVMLAACPFPTHQGTQVFIRHLATALSRAGHHVHLVCYGEGDPDEALPFTVHRALAVPVGCR
ncbi:MAG TPA: hypothetical protein VFH51_20005, partial [Myxococcota bacterium]|nr:hypothetical protein [Myxococcota bacterium]